MIDYALGSDGIAVLTMDMPGRSANVINADFTAALDQAVDTVLGDQSVVGAVMTSAKSTFLAGADLDALMQVRTAEQAMAACQTFQTVLRKLETGGKPFVAAMNGSALGGGQELALACHRRLAADVPHARFGQPEVTLGLVPGGGATQRLPRMVGAREALLLLVEGKKLSATGAQKAGIVDDIVAPDMLVEAARAAIADDTIDPVKAWDTKKFKLPGGGVWTKSGMESFLAGNAMLHEKTRGNYPAPQAIMSCVFEGLQVTIDVGLRIEARWFAHTLLGDVARNMVRTFFFNIGAANKLVRRPAGYAPAAFKKIGVLGAGMMGAGIGHVSAQSGLDVVLLDSTKDKAEAGKAHAAALQSRQVEKGRATPEARDAVLARLTPTDRFEDLAGCELVIEAVFENRDIKADVTRKSEAVIGPDAVFASNTSTLPITGLAEASARPEQFIGLHFFSPVERMPLVEIIRGERTSDACLAAAMDYVKQVGKTPIVVTDSRGFYTSRVFATYVQEGLAMLDEGIKPALIENAGKLAGMPVGPLAVADEVSLDLMHKVRAQTRRDLGDDYGPGPGDGVLDTMVSTHGRLGRKSAKGFYDYPSNDGKRLWPGLSEDFPARGDQPDVEALKQRLLFVQAVETVRCLQEGVLLDPADGDVGAILGWGFAPHTGGPLSLIDTVGAEAFTAACDSLAQRHGARFTPPEMLRDMAKAGGQFHTA